MIFSLRQMQIDLLITLVIFGLIAWANAYEIIAFNRACQYESYETDEHVLVDHKVVMKKKGEVKEGTQMFLWRVKYYSDKWLGKFWSKPIYSCPTCMASAHGILPFIFAGFLTMPHEKVFTTPIFFAWIFYTLVVSGIATLMNEK